MQPKWGCRRAQEKKAAGGLNRGPSQPPQRGGEKAGLREVHRSCPNGGQVNCKKHDRPPPLAGPWALQVQHHDKRYKVCFASMPDCKPDRFTNASLLLLQWAGVVLAEPARRETFLPDFAAEWNGRRKKNRKWRSHTNIKQLYVIRIK